MERGRFRVVGNTDRLRFVESGCTKTRFTGVAGCYILWEVPDGHLMQFFCLDFETEGIKGYKSLHNGSEAQQEDMKKEAIGVYGETFEQLSEAEAMDLLNILYAVTLKFHRKLPGETLEYARFLDRNRGISEQAKEELEVKLSKSMESDFEAANYYMGRALSGDVKAEGRLLVIGQRVNLARVPGKCILLKNEITQAERFKGTRYLSCRALARCGMDYHLVVARLGMMDTDCGVKLSSAEFIESKSLSVGEASMIMKRTEYLLVYQAADNECFDKALLVEKPCIEKEVHERGVLFTQFKRDNAHYKKQVYYMNDDIFGLYFLMEEGKLIAATFSEEAMKNMNAFISRPCFRECLTLEKAFYSENPLFYQIVNQEAGKGSGK